MSKSIADQPFFPTAFDQISGCSRREVFYLKIVTALLVAHPSLSSSPIALAQRATAIVDQCFQELTSLQCHQNGYHEEPIPESELPF